MDVAYIKRIGVYVLITVLALALIASLVYHSFRKLSDDLELAFIEAETHLQTVEMSAFMLATEHVIDYAQYTDSMPIDYPLGDNTLVSIGDTVAEVYRSDVDRSLITRLKDARSRLEFYQTASFYAARQSVESLGEKIKKCERDISATEDTSRKSELVWELKVLLAAQAAKMDDSLGYSDLIKSCQNEINSISSSLGGAQKTFVSDVNGAYFAKCDGYENVMSASELGSADLSYLKDLVSGSLESSYTGTGVGKLVDMNTWSLVCLTDKQSSLKLHEGKSINVTLGRSGNTHSLTVQRVLIDRQGEDAIVILSSSRMMDCEDYSHFQKVTVQLGSEKGYKIPVGAVRYENGVSGVYVLRGSKVIYRQIDIVGAGDGYVIAATNVSSPVEGLSSLNRYDRVIVRGHDLYNGKVIV